MVLFIAWETIELKAALPSDFRRGDPPDEGKEGDANDDYIF